MREPLTPWSQSVARFVIWSATLSLAWAIRGPAGAIVVLAAGLAIQRGLRYGWWTLRPGAVRETYLACQFIACGRLAKSGGRVSEQDIAAVESLMRGMGLGAAQREAAIQAFNLGRRFQQGQPSSQVARDFARLKRMAMRQPGLKSAFLQVVIRTVLRGRAARTAERETLLSLASWIGADEALLRECLAADSASSGGGSEAEACQELGLDAQASVADIKQAYRALMRRYHPDKLAANPLSDAERQAADEKVRRVRAAYDQLKRLRGFR